MTTNVPPGAATDGPPPSLEAEHLDAGLAEQRQAWAASTPFPHVVIDGFVPAPLAAALSDHFPRPDHPVWLDWRKRSPNQYGKLGPGDSKRFATLDWRFLHALQQFNSWIFLEYLEKLTSIKKLLPDPYFTGGGMHQILKGGLLDIHTDFNFYPRLGIYRRLNVLLYLNKDWQESYGGCLELWDGPLAEGGKCVKEVPPLFNRAVIFQTDKTSFHGHPREWNGPDGVCRRSVALYYYTAEKAEGMAYDARTDFQNYARKDVPKD